MRSPSRSAVSILVLLALVALVACAPVEESAPAESASAEPAIDLAAEEAAAKAVNVRWLELQRARDAEGIGNLFVADGWRLTDEGLTDGRAAIIEEQQENMEENPDSIEDWGVKQFWIAESGDLAVERGWWSGDEDGEGGDDPVEGEYVTVLVKRDGEWKALVDASVPLEGAGGDE